ncbi:TetR-family transcriptional regulator (plasmid) [Streptantibioticus cattleyicolor NRRL 8057 = DSM 46488]|nr:TetR-family transcriptional regulator [Streptantibioticus cattleyicolor NRRL 8057 = DSM 46488]
MYEAVLDLLREDGYDLLTMDAVAARCKCSKATLYRQWQGKPRLVAAAMRHGRPFSLDDVDTGSLHGDLHELARRLGEAKKDVRLIRAVAPAVPRNADLAEALRETLVQPEIDLIGTLLARAVARGEVAADAPAAAFVPHLLSGAVFARPLIEQLDADTDYLQRFLDAVVLPVLTRR